MASSVPISVATDGPQILAQPSFEIRDAHLFHDHNMTINGHYPKPDGTGVGGVGRSRVSFLTGVAQLPAWARSCDLKEIDIRLRQLVLYCWIGRREVGRNFISARKNLFEILFQWLIAGKVDCLTQAVEEPG